MPTPPPDLRCRWSEVIELAATTPRVVDVPVNGATHWVVVVKNTGSANPLTALTVAASPLGGAFEAPAVVTDGMPLAAGDALPGLRGTGEPITTLRLVLTSTLGTTVLLEAAGR